MPTFGPLELVIILVIVAMLFGVGKLPEVFGAVGKGVREFRTNASADTPTEEITAEATTAKPKTEAAPAAAAVAAEPESVKTAEPT